MASELRPGYKYVGDLVLSEDTPSEGDRLICLRCGNLCVKNMPYSDFARLRFYCSPECKRKAAEFRLNGE